MQWFKTDNPWVWEASDGRHYALVEDSPVYSDRAYMGRVYARPLQASFLENKSRRVGIPVWGADPEAALRMVIRGFDPEAELPERDKVLP